MFGNRCCDYERCLKQRARELKLQQKELERHQRHIQRQINQHKKNRDAYGSAKCNLQPSCGLRDTTDILKSWGPKKRRKERHRSWFDTLCGGCFYFNKHRRKTNSICEAYLKKIIFGGLLYPLEPPARTRQRGYMADDCHSLAFGNIPQFRSNRSSLSCTDELCRSILCCVACLLSLFIWTPLIIYLLLLKCFCCACCSDC